MEHVRLAGQLVVKTNSLVREENSWRDFASCRIIGLLLWVAKAADGESFDGDFGRGLL